MSGVGEHPHLSARPPVHVLVVAYGDPRRSASASRHSEAAYPVVVVDNASSQATRDVVTRVGATYLDARRTWVLRPP